MATRTPTPVARHARKGPFRQLVTPILTAALVLTGSDFASAQPTGTRVIACRPATPAVEVGQSVELRAFVGAATPADLQYRWHADGKIQGEGAIVIWHLPATGRGAYTASVNVSGSSFTGTCTMQVFALNSGAERGNELRRRFLVSKQEEESGFHLYSYVLLGSPPPDLQTRQRYLAALQSFLSFLPLPDDLVKKDDFNLTVLPVTAIPARKEETEAAWLLDHYDWERARFFLRRLQGTHLAGPYIVSFTQPLTTVGTLEKEYLFQDLSAVPRELVIAWVREFMMQSTQQQFWAERTGPMLALKLRTTIGVIAGTISDATVVAQAITWR